MNQVLFVCFGMKLYALNLAGLQCTGANPNALRLAIHHNANFLYVHTPSALGSIIRVGYVMSRTRAFASNEAFASHDYTSSELYTVKPAAKSIHNECIRMLVSTLL
jgi:hypothetical protein